MISITLNLILFTIINILDLLTTKIFLLIGEEEGNPIGRLLLKRFGFNSLIIFKIISTIIIAFSSILNPLLLLLSCLNIFGGLVLIYNCVSILKIAKRIIIIN